MLSVKENALLTQVGPGTPGGNMLRCYWLPVALSEEVPPGGAPVSQRVLGEDLVLFRDEHGQCGLLARQCSHRCADLSYGRIEAGGLRCLYHGWVYDVAGNCLQQPGEPAGSNFAQKIHHPAYPCQEAGGLIFAYMGAGEPPLLPGYEFFDVPEENRYVTKAFHDCNYLQGNEGSIDPVHTSYLHRIFDEGGGQVVGTNNSVQDLLGGDLTPRIEVEKTDWGLQLYTLRAVGESQTYARVTGLLFPVAGTFSGPFSGPGYEGYGINWHVPIDDNTHWKFLFRFSRKKPLEAYMKADSPKGPDYLVPRNRENRHLQDREEMKTKTFAGFGTDFSEHDTAVVESMGPIVDRSHEHLGSTDKAIITYRQMLLEAVRDVQRGSDPLHVVRDPEQNRFFDLAGGKVISSTDDWRTAWRTQEMSTPAT